MQPIIQMEFTIGEDKVRLSIFKIDGEYLSKIEKI